MKPEILYPRRDVKIGESAAEIMLLYMELSSKGEVYSIIDDEINSCELLNTIAEMAIEFEIHMQIQMIGCMILTSLQQKD